MTPYGTHSGVALVVMHLPGMASAQLAIKLVSASWGSQWQNSLTLHRAHVEIRSCVRVRHPMIVLQVGGVAADSASQPVHANLHTRLLPCACFSQQACLSPR